MDLFNQQTTKSNKQQSANSPFARALAEMEQGGHAGDHQAGNKQKTEQKLNSADSAAKTLSPDQQEIYKQQQQEQLKKQQMRERLHRKVNPVEQQDVFDAREQQVKKELEEVRKELKLLAEDFNKFYKEVDVTLEKNIASPGQEGVYYSSFFAKLKAFILLLRQKVKSAQTWAKQMQAKKRKQQQKRGLNFAGNEAKATHDMLHHERYNAYSGA